MFFIDLKAVEEKPFRDKVILLTINFPSLQ